MSQPEAARHSVELFERLSEVTGRAQQMMLEFWTEESDRLFHDIPAMSEDGALDALAGVTAMWSNWAQAFLHADTSRIAGLTGDFWSDSLRLWSGMLNGGAAADVPAAAARPDKRFQASQWSDYPVFDMIRRSYLLASHYLLEVVGALDGVPDPIRERMLFQTRQFVDAMSPANFAALNPEVIDAAIASRGETLLTGLRNLLDDLKRGKLTMTDEHAFEVGRNLAATPGKVIFENRLFQLVQYAPTTGTVHETPLLIFPPWINKFYILDLTPEKSFVRWAVARGYTVFIVSWRQACPELADVTLDSYVLEGQLTAIEKVLEITATAATHVLGYCVAGTTLAATLAYLAATGAAGKIRSATFLTSQVDFTEAGELLHMVDEQMLACIDALATGKGYLDGRWLATSFNMLRPTELIWNYVVNNYLKGKENIPFDLLYWNSDPTNVPARWHRDYLRRFYRENLLVKPGAVEVAGVPIDLRKVETPVYIQIGRDDHIVPAPSGYKLIRAFSGPHRLALAGSGHIAGVVNPPQLGKYQYWTMPDGVPEPERLSDFQAQAVETKGSWWPDWDRWLAPQSGPEVPARMPGTVPGFPVIEDAPGRYVRERIA